MKPASFFTSPLGTITVLVVMTTAMLMLTSCEARKDASKAAVISRIKKNDVLKGRNTKRQIKTNNKNLNSGCEEIHLPMCKGLVPYTHTKLPNRFNHTSQLQVYRVLEHLWAYIDQPCSKNLRLLACGTYMPKCNGKQTAVVPCKKTCLQAKKKCAEPLKELMGMNWDERFDCKGLPASRCLKPVKDGKCPEENTHCVKNSVFPVCANLTFTWGTMPNMFGQCSVEDLNTEIQHFDALIATNCHANLGFLVCGVFSPFCGRHEVPFMLPCRELCEEVRQACEPHYKRLYHGLPWPQKLQCHRYPNSENKDFQCVMPNEGSTFLGGK